MVGLAAGASAIPQVADGDFRLRRPRPMSAQKSLLDVGEVAESRCRCDVETHDVGHRCLHLQRISVLLQVVPALVALSEGGWRPAGWESGGVLLSSAAVSVAAAAASSRGLWTPRL